VGSRDENGPGVGDCIVFGQKKLCTEYFYAVFA